MKDIKNHLLKIIDEEFNENGAYSIRENKKSIDIHSSENIIIIPKTDVEGIDVNILDNTKNAYVHIPVVITKSGITDEVYNDFYIGDNVTAVINAGCGIHSDAHKDSMHSGIHRFFVGKNSCVKYIEKHYGESESTGKQILNPKTEIHLEKNAILEMDTAQIKGVSSTNRETTATLEDSATLIIYEKIYTHDNQTAKTTFDLSLNGKGASTKVVSRSVAEDDSIQEFISNVEGNNECFAHIECDAIIKDNAKAVSTPKINANHVDAKLNHEATIGKIAGDQLIKLMTLGLSKKEAEATIINGFLK